MNYSSNNNITQLISDFNNDIYHNFNVEMMYNQQQIKDLTSKLYHKDNQIHELDKIIQQIITIKDMIIYSLERKIKELEKPSE